MGCLPHKVQITGPACPHGLWSSQMVKRPLQLLLIEDSDDDAVLLEIEMQRAGYAPLCHRVETPEALRSALERQNWDLVIADYRLPGFDALAALTLVKEKGLDLP